MISLFLIFMFLPISLGLYYISSDNFKNIVLIVVSFVFYSYADASHFILFVFMALINTFLAYLMSKSCKKIKNILLCMGIVGDVGCLLYFKFFNSIIDGINCFTNSEYSFENIIMPLGISYFSFKAVSLLVDVWKEKINIAGRPLMGLLYLSFFAQMESGPLSRISDFNITEIDKNIVFLGAKRFVIGINKKILLANILGKVAIEVFGSDLNNASTSYLWIGSIAFSLQLYYDFSGYSDMAIGVSQLFGFNCPENFNYPYISKSFSDFWRRWHISLGQWFRDYVYIPLGGSKVGKKRMIFNLLVVWLLTGFWHGSNMTFIIWGISYFILISIEKIFLSKYIKEKRIFASIYQIVVLFIVNFEWVIFNSKDISFGLKYIKYMIIPTYNSVSDLRVLFLIKEYGLFMLIGCILSTPIMQRLGKKVNKNEKLEIISLYTADLVLIVLFLVSISFLVAGANNPFAYTFF